MRALFFQGGRPFVAEVSGPGLAAGRILVEVHYSAVSPGTEGSLLDSSSRTFLSLALEKRHRVDRLWRALRRRDFRDVRTRMQRLAGQSQTWFAPGYSAAGIVREAGPGADPFAPGDRVAIAGAGYATHSEFASVPRNLAVRVPEGLDLIGASSVAIGAIALQAVRRADSRVGETVLVLGLGLLGQMTARILAAGGCRVLGWDPKTDRMTLAATHGIEALPAAAMVEVAPAVMARTGGQGADQVVIAAAGGAQVVEAGALSTRRSGTLVLLGDTPVAVQRATAYERELTIRMSTSYGPGRYDPRYEEEGIDYPFAHVRWTENRNMAAWLDLLAGGRVRLDGLLQSVRELEDAAAAYVALRQGSLESLGLVFRHRPSVANPVAQRPAASASTTEPARRSPPLRIAFLGTGAYASAGILPALAPLAQQVRLELLVGTTPARREPLAKQHSFTRTGESYEEGAVDPGVDLVAVATRHDRHADLVLRALEAGRAVFCEKPLALAEEDLDRIESTLSRKNGFLALGFNRRFAPAVVRLRKELDGRRGPLQISYRVQAGPLPTEHWIRGPEGAGRLVGECVHMVDLVRFLTGAPLERAWVLPGGGGPEGDPGADNFHLGLRYADGSSATILYTSRGSSLHPKERIELHGEARSFELINFSELREAGRREPLYKSASPDKGQQGLWRACVEALLSGRPSPTPGEEVLETSRAVLALERERRSG